MNPTKIHEFLVLGKNFSNDTEFLAFSLFRSIFYKKNW